jgi:hypothetical protein
VDLSYDRLLINETVSASGRYQQVAWSGVMSVYIVEVLCEWHPSSHEYWIDTES